PVSFTYCVKSEKKDPSQGWGPFSRSSHILCAYGFHVQDFQPDLFFIDIISRVPHRLQGKDNIDHQTFRIGSELCAAA
ncbi:MAG TPA: hypothetical protein VFK47_01685, partial [Ktedonobacteraceae bacterium]|nr:hypothetical protein [Ktedonobacteraceae bacterium]